MRGLRLLDLGFNRLRATTAKVFEDAPAFAQLRGLALTGNELGDGGIDHLSRSTQLDQLLCLYLGLCSIKETGAKALARGAGLRALTDLDLWGNRIGDMGTTIADEETRPPSAGYYGHWQTLHEKMVLDAAALGIRSDSDDLVGPMVRNICYGNAKNFLGLQVE